MRATGLTLLGLVVALAQVPHGTLGRTPIPVSNGTSLFTIPDNYVIEFTGAPGTSAGSSASRDFYSTMATQNIPFTIRKNYTRLLNGAYIGVQDKYYDAVYNIGTALSLWSSRTSSVNDSPIPPATKALPPRPFLAHEYTGINKVRNSTSWTGAGVKVGILDTGLDYTHPAFGNCFNTTNCRVRYGYDFVGDAYNGNNIPVPDRDPMDSCNGHGTHVAGILAGNDGVFQGVAPNATLGIYRILGCSGLVESSVIIEAVETAYNDGMHIINLSIANVGGWNQWAESSVIDKAIAKGIYVVGSAGNNGAEGLWALGAPAVSPNTIAVGSMEVPRMYSWALDVTVSGQTYRVRRTDQQPTSIPLDITNAPFRRGLDAAGNDYACQPITANVKGAIVLIQRGFCDFDTKATNVIKAGGLAAVMYNSDGSEMQTPEYYAALTLPTVGIWQRDGQKFVTLLAGSQSATATMTQAIDIVDSDVPYTPSAYSSWGPNIEAVHKPDVMAPGTNIYSTLPKSRGSYGLVSGTSMAAPYVAGVVALVLQTNITASNLTVLSNVLHTATPYKHSSGMYYSLAQQGTGLINAYNALTANIAFRIRYKLICGYTDVTNMAYPITLFYTNRATTNLVYNFQVAPSISVSGFGVDKRPANPPLTDTTTAVVTMSTTSSFTAPGTNGSNDITIKRGKMADSSLLIYSGYIQAYPAPGYSGQNYSFPYLGYGYSSSSVTIFDPSYDMMPCMFRSLDRIPLPAKSNTTFTFTGNDYPVVAFRLQHPVRQIQIKVAYAETPTAIHSSVTQNQYAYRSRNFDGTSQGQFFEFKWDGMGYYQKSPSTIFMHPSRSYVLIFTFRTVYMSSKAITYTTPVIHIPKTIKS